MARGSASSTAALAAWGAVGRGRDLSAHRVAVVADDRGARHELEFGFSHFQRIAFAMVMIARAVSQSTSLVIRNRSGLSPRRCAVAMASRCCSANPRKSLR